MKMLPIRASGAVMPCHKPTKKPGPCSVGYGWVAQPLMNRTLINSNGRTYIDFFIIFIKCNFCLSAAYTLLYNVFAAALEAKEFGHFPYC